MELGRPRDPEDVSSPVTLALTPRSELVAPILASAHAAWPNVAHDDDRFLAHLASKLSSDRADLSDRADALRALHTDDLYLASACADGIARAHDVFDRAVLPSIDRPVARLHGGDAITSEVRQLVRELVLLPRASAPPRIAEFSGRSKLSSWLRVIAVREAVRLLNKNRRELPTEEDAIAAALDPDAGPELRYFKQLYGAEFRAALREAIERLSDREKILLRQNVLDGASIDRLAALYGVHRATAARWLTAAREALLHRTRETLRGRLQVTPSELDSILRLIQSQLDVSLRRLLK
jgi:RNA polymerase sigma-70 factor (ECF subfamily)